MMEAELCSGILLHSGPVRAFSHWSNCDGNGDDELSVLPPHTKVIVTGNNRTKSVLVGLQGVVKKAVGLGGWHWLVLKNGVEVKLQRNALSVLEAPTGEEEEDDNDDIVCDNSVCSSSDTTGLDFSGLDFPKTAKARVRHPKSAKLISRNNSIDIHSNTNEKTQTSRVNLAKLGTPTLWKYWRHFNLVSVNPNPTKEQLMHGVQHHFLSQQLDEMQVIGSFIHTAKRLRSSDSECNM